MIDSNSEVGHFGQWLIFWDNMSSHFIMDFLRRFITPNPLLAAEECSQCSDSGCFQGKLVYYPSRTQLLWVVRQLFLLMQVSSLFTFQARYSLWSRVLTFSTFYCAYGWSTSVTGRVSLWQCDSDSVTALQISHKTLSIYSPAQNGNLNELYLVSAVQIEQIRRGWPLINVYFIIQIDYDMLTNS